MGRTRKPRGRYHHGNLREALLEAAAAIAAEQGVDAIQVKDLAKATGVSRAAPFRHFPTRQDLLVAAAEAAADRQIRRRDAACEGLDDPLARAQAGAVAYVRWAVDEPGWFRLLTQPGMLEHSARLSALNAHNRTALAEALGAPRADADSPVLAERSAAMLAAQAMIYGLARMLVDGNLGEVAGDDAEALAWQLTELLGRGIDAGDTDAGATDAEG